MTEWGTHNLGDERGTPTPFAPILLLTEAVLPLGLPGYIVAPCPWQRDLVIAWKRGTFTPKRKRLGRISKHYRLVHPGIPKVTPHRGTFWINGTLDGEPTTLLVEHRINAAFPPFKRGEKWLRQRWWRKHTRITLRIVRRLKKRGRLVLAGGDTNTPAYVSAYEGELFEGGHHYDRVGASVPLAGVEYLSRMGSDHPRLRAHRATDRKGSA